MSLTIFNIYLITPHYILYYIYSINYTHDMKSGGMLYKSILIDIDMSERIIIGISFFLCYSSSISSCMTCIKKMCLLNFFSIISPKKKLI
jgi:hypothetical protein